MSSMNSFAGSVSFLYFLPTIAIHFPFPFCISVFFMLLWTLLSLPSGLKMFRNECWKSILLIHASLRTLICNSEGQSLPCWIQIFIEFPVEIEKNSNIQSALILLLLFLNYICQFSNFSIRLFWFFTNENISVFLAYVWQKFYENWQSSNPSLRSFHTHLALALSSIKRYFWSGDLMENTKKENNKRQEKMYLRSVTNYACFCSTKTRRHQKCLFFGREFYKKVGKVHANIQQLVGRN